MFKVGSRVILTDLKSFPWLNSSEAIIESHDSQTDVFNVRVDADGSLRSVGRRNLNEIQSQKGWTRAYSEWVDGASQQVTAAFGAATEVTAVVVPGFIIPRNVKHEQPKREVPLKYLLLISITLTSLQLFLFDSPLANLLFCGSVCVSIFVLCSGLNRLVKLIVLLGLCCGSVWIKFR